MELAIDRLTKQYKNKIAVDRVSIKLKPGVYGLLGANGAGKTTLMRMICDIQNPTSGQIKYNGTDIKELGEDYRQVLGYLPQDFGYYPDFTAYDFLMYIAALKGLSKEKAEMRVNELLQIVNLENEKKQKVKTFSGGMKQRLGIAQAMLNNPKILILDEPTAGLDPKGRDEILDQIAYLHKSCDMTVILVSHSMEDIAKYVDRIIVMNRGSMLFDDVPKKVFEHYQELEQVGLSAPQVTYIMHELREKGLEVPVNITTIEEATDAIVAALAKKNEKRGQ